MNPKKKAVAVATAGTVLGLGGLGLIAIPAGANEAPPELPAISAQKLVESVLSAETPALHGTVEMENNVGLPTLPQMQGMPPLDFETAEVYYDGAGKGRVAVHDGANEYTMVHDGNTLWTYSSGEGTATKTVLPEQLPERAKDMKSKAGMADPTKAAAALLAKAKETSKISVDGTASVAGRDAYELVLTPKPSEKTLLRSIRVAVDYETRLPLRLSVMVNGTTESALSIGFSEIEFGNQPAELFEFTPPQGTEVKVRKPDVEDAKQAHDSAKQVGDLKVVGKGWDTVLVGKLGEDILAGSRQMPGSGGGDIDPRKILEQIAEPVSGPFGSGYVIELNGGTVLITEDGRAAAGAVPQQVLVQALGSK